MLLNIIKQIKMFWKKKQGISIGICQKKRKKQKGNIPRIDAKKWKRNNLENIKISYYWFNREKLLKNAWDKYHNNGGKQKAAAYYRRDVDFIRLEAKNKYKNLSEKYKNKKKEISKRKIPHEYWLKWEIKATSKKLLCFKKIKKWLFYSIKDEWADIKIWWYCG